MKNKKYIILVGIITLLIMLIYNFEYFRYYYLVKNGNKNFYSGEYNNAISYYEKALKIKEDPNIRINIVLAEYANKEYEKVVNSENADYFIKGNSKVKLLENKYTKLKNQEEDKNE